MSDPDQSSHWQFLVNILGAKPKEDPASGAAKSGEPPTSDEAANEPARSSGPSGPPPAGPSKPEKPPRKAGETIREKLTHWSNVLKSVGVDPPPLDVELPPEEPEEAETPRIVESIPSPFAQGKAEPPPAPEATPSDEDPLQAWPSKPARPAPPAKQERGREQRAGSSGRQREDDRGRERGRDRERKREREREGGRKRETEREQSEAGERGGERHRRSDRGRPHDVERGVARPAPDEIAESLFDDEELHDIELEPSEPESSTRTGDEDETPDTERRSRRRRRGRRGRRDRESATEGGAEKDRTRSRTEDEDEEEDVEVLSDSTVERPTRIETPFESGEVEFDESEEEIPARHASREERDERRERTGRRRRRRPRSGRDDDAVQARRAAEALPSERMDEEMELDEEVDEEERLPLVDELVTAPEESELDDDDEEDDDVPMRPVRSSVPSWEDAISDIIARNMANRHKSGGVSGHSGGGRRGRGRGGRRNGPRDRHGN